MESNFIQEIPSDIFFDLKQIGSGTFSRIYSATHIKTNNKVALKISVKTKDPDMIEVIKRETSIHKSLNHPLICKYFTDFDTEHLHIIVMELIEGVDLLSYVNRTKGISVKEAQNIFAQIVIVLEYLHEEKCITHRDLKLENIMIDNYNHIRLIDFGFSSPKNIMSTLCGSIPYCSPEILKCNEYAKESDIWSLGIILYALISGQLPFYHTNTSKMISIICKCEPCYPNNFDPCLVDLLSKLLTKDANQRITIDSIKMHPFMSHVGFFQINYKRIFSSNSLQSPPRRRAKSEIRTSISNPNILSNRFMDVSFKRRYKSLLSCNSNSDLLCIDSISKLHNIVTLNTENVDDLIISRKDYPMNLDKLIDAALFDNSQNKINMDVSHIKLRSSLPSHFVISSHNFSIKNQHNRVILSPSPLIAKPI